MDEDDDQQQTEQPEPADYPGPIRLEGDIIVKPWYVKGPAR